MESFQCKYFENVFVAYLNAIKEVAMLLQSLTIDQSKIHCMWNCLGMLSKTIFLHIVQSRMVIEICNIEFVCLP